MYYVAEICMLYNQNWVKICVVGEPLQKVKLQWLLQDSGATASISMSFLSQKTPQNIEPR